MGGKTIFFLFLASLISSIPTVRSQINVWPQPRAISWPTPEAIHLSHCFTIQSPAHPHLRHAVRRYLRLIHAERHHPIRPVAVNLTRSPPLDSLRIAISDLSAPLQHGVSESYNLTIPKPGGGSAAKLRAETAWGAMRGLETFSQLVWVGRKDGRLTVAVGLQVRDGPLFPHRGVLLDTSRNFYGVKDLKRLIRAMAMNKLNVFHWHITDSQSFPLVVESESELGKKGSYGEEMQYDVTDVRRVVEYGMRHGVRVMPEIDTPGKFCHYSTSRFDLNLLMIDDVWPT